MVLPQQGVLCQHKGDALICELGVHATVDFVEKNLLSAVSFLPQKEMFHQTMDLKFFS